MSSRSEKVASKSDVSYKDTKVTSEPIYEALQRLDSGKAVTAYPAKSTMMHPRDAPPPDENPKNVNSDHREWDSQKGETDYREWYERDEAYRESWLLLDDREEEDLTTDPLLAHKLLLPFDRMPRPRMFHIVDETCVEVTLPKRSRSFVRYILPTRFDLRKETTELLKQQNFFAVRKYLRQLKDQLSQRIKQIMCDVDYDIVICMLVLRALCDMVTMANDIEADMELHSFVSAIINWTLIDLHILDRKALDENERFMLATLESDDVSKMFPSDTTFGLLNVPKIEKIFKDLNFQTYMSAQMHKCLPWSLVAQAHHRGTIKFYPTVKDRIDKILQVKCTNSAYVPDLTCFHFTEVPDDDYVINNRKISNKNRKQNTFSKN